MFLINTGCEVDDMACLRGLSTSEIVNISSSFLVPDIFDITVEKALPW